MNNNWIKHYVLQYLTIILSLLPYMKYFELKTVNYFHISDIIPTFVV